MRAGHPEKKAFGLFKLKQALLACRFSNKITAGWGGHMLVHESDRNAAPHAGAVNLPTRVRTLGFVLDDAEAAQARQAGLAAQPIFRRFGNTTKSHAASLEATCNGRGRPAFSLGHDGGACTATAPKRLHGGGCGGRGRLTRHANRRATASEAHPPCPGSK